MIRIYNESECITKKNANLYQRNILFFIMHPPGYIKCSNLKWTHEQMVALPRFKYFIMSLHGLLLSLSLPPGNAIFLENSNCEPAYTKINVIYQFKGIVSDIALIIPAKTMGITDYMYTED